MTRNVRLEISGAKRIGYLCAAALIFSITAPYRGTAEPYRSAVDAPLAWGVFSKHLKSECELALQANNEIARRLNAELEKLQAAAKSNDPPVRVNVSLWIKPTGAVERVSFAPLSTDQATSDLNMLLTGVEAGAPPADMLQPVRLLLSLEPRK
jgi:hypothetical protein